MLKMIIETLLDVKKLIQKETILGAKKTKTTLSDWTKLSLIQWILFWSQCNNILELFQGDWRTFVV